MTSTKDVIRHLQQTQRDAIENKTIEEIPQSELDQITGARGDFFFKGEWKRALGK